MEHILIPTDFSPASLNAFQYALKLADVKGTRITLFHAYSIPMLEPHVSGYMQDALLNRQEDQALEHFAEVEKEVPQEMLQNVSLDYQISMGPAVEEILYQSERLTPSMIVMGMRGGNTLAKKIFGTVATGIIQRGNTPLMIIPEEVSYRDIQHIAYATDLEQENPFVIDQLLSFGRLVNAVVHCIHIRREGTEKEYYKEEILRKAYQYELSIHDLEIQSFEDNDIMQGIQQFVDHEGMDVLAMLTSQRGFLGRLFHRSLTRQMAIVTHIPLLVFHKNGLGENDKFL